MGPNSSAGRPMPRCGQRWVCRSMRPGVTSLPAASMRCTARSGGMLGATAAICPNRMPMSRFARVFCTGSSTSPLAITSSYFIDASAGLKPSGAGVPAWASSRGASGGAPASAAASPAPASVPPAAAAPAEGLMNPRRERSLWPSWPPENRRDRGTRLRRAQARPPLHDRLARVAEAAVAPDQGIGRAVVVEPGLGGSLGLGRDASGQRLAELHTPLVERVDAPDGALHEDLVLVERHQPSERGG